MSLNLGLMKELIWVLQLVPLKDIIMTSLMVHLMGSPWDEKMEMHWYLLMVLWTAIKKELSWVTLIVL